MPVPQTPDRTHGPGECATAGSCSPRPFTLRPAQQCSCASVRLREAETGALPCDGRLQLSAPTRRRPWRGGGFQPDPKEPWGPRRWQSFFVLGCGDHRCVPPHHVQSSLKEGSQVVLNFHPALILFIFEYKMSGGHRSIFGDQQELLGSKIAVTVPMTIMGKIHKRNEQKWRLNPQEDLCPSRETQMFLPPYPTRLLSALLPCIYNLPNPKGRKAGL
ncbi:uncharacterized protein LOC104870818 [Fukomys damarensis]|uniref:uncharacterized protein LOC104870818 n=1 Tax=Fukomys damarensis TaxID=885580 RepID=UPI00053F6ABC|nr:uncharacterized protein LOC104870818 [Fukomys damarensis]